MSLQVWLPLLGNLNNQGIQGNTVTSSNYSSASGGKLGTCIKTNANGNIPLGYSSKQCNTGSLSICGWFKFNKTEIWNTISSLTYNSTDTGIGCSIIGNNSYGGVGIYATSNSIYADGTLNSLSIRAYWRTSAAGAIGTNTYTISWDTWVHACATYNKETNLVSFYINGSLFSYATIPSFTDMKDASIAINFAGIAGGNGLARSIPMSVNDVRIYDHALSKKEVAEIAKALVLHYKLDDLIKGNLITNYDTSFNSIANGTITIFYNQMYYGTQEVVASAGGVTKCLHLVSNGSSNRMFQSVSVSAGKSYTVSCDYYSAYAINIPFRGELNGGNYSWQGSNSGPYSTPYQWQRVSFTFTNLTSNTTLYYFMHCAQGTDCYIKNIKVEEGTFATPWVPAGQGESLVAYDSSGFGYDGYWQSGRNMELTSDTARYSASTLFPLTSSQTGNYVTMDNASLFSALSTCTLCWWGKYNVAKSLLITGQSTSYFVAAGNPSFYNQNANMSKYYVDGVQVSSVPSYVAGQWHHYVLVVNLSSWTKMMLNNYGSADTWSINGKISDFRIYAKELTADEILELYHTEASMDRGGNYYTRELME